MALYETEKALHLLFLTIHVVSQYGSREGNYWIKLEVSVFKSVENEGMPIKFCLA